MIKLIADKRAKNTPAIEEIEIGNILLKELAPLNDYSLNRRIRRKARQEAYRGTEKESEAQEALHQKGCKEVQAGRTSLTKYCTFNARLRCNVFVRNDREKGDIEAIYRADE